MSVPTRSPALDVAAILDGDSGLGLTYGTDLFVWRMPDSPDECVCLYDTGGFDGELNYVYERPTIQIIVRGGKTDAEGADGLARSIKAILCPEGGLHDVEVEGTRYVCFWMQGEPIFMGYDGLGRPKVSMNFLTNRTDAA